MGLSLDPINPVYGLRTPEGGLFSGCAGTTSTTASQGRGSGKGGSSDLTDYRAPTADILQALDVAGLNSVLALPTFSHLDRETVELAIIEFGRFASKVLG